MKGCFLFLLCLQPRNPECIAKGDWNLLGERRIRARGAAQAALYVMSAETTDSLSSAEPVTLPPSLGRENLMFANSPQEHSPEGDYFHLSVKIILHYFSSLILSYQLSGLTILPWFLLAVCHTDGGLALCVCVWFFSFFFSFSLSFFFSPSSHFPVWHLGWRLKILNKLLMSPRFKCVKETRKWV